ncbi:OadG family protein [Nitrincola alkalilacustris]|uniref:OadG family protein n=1 Tax=Nitrincola alkalilacustris TaxID=1571224 RepID=UPI00124C1A1A|nr:OadG family transporter subunit [Nitrincola alkalilacustris]
MDELLAEGLTLMAFGMGFVVVFLTLLIIVTMFMSWLVVRFEPAPVIKPVKAKTAPAQAASSDAQLTAVMTAAIHKYRSRRNGQ